VFGPESWTLSQSYFIGHLEDRPEPQLEITPGETIDELEDLEETAIGKPYTVGGGNGSAYSGPVDEAALIDAIVKGASYHPGAMSLLGRWARQGVALREAEQRLRTAFECVFPADRDERWQQRHTVRHGRAVAALLRARVHHVAWGVAWLAAGLLDRRRAMKCNSV
jgi:hypothetical protein